jgi:hypothetical protein
MVKKIRKQLYYFISKGTEEGKGEGFVKTEIVNVFND